MRTSPRHLSIVLLAAAMGASLALSGCTPISLKQKAWEDRLDSATGVIDAKWAYHNGWPSSGAAYTGTVEVSPTLTEAQAREIASLSCKGQPRIDTLYLDTTAESGSWRATQYGLQGSCFEPETLVQFTMVLDAIRALGSEMSGEVIVYGFDPKHATQGEVDDGSLDLTAEVAEPALLFTLLSEIQARTPGVPLNFGGTIDGKDGDDGDTYSSINVQLPADYPLADVMPLLNHAYELPHLGVRFTPDGLVLIAGTVEMMASPEVAQVRRLADEAGIGFEILLFEVTHLDEAQTSAYETLVRDISALPGITSVQLPGSIGAAITSIQASDWGAIPAALEFITTGTQVTNEFYLTGPEPTMFVRVLKADQPNPSALTAYTRMMQTLETVPHAGFAALIVHEDDISMRFDLDASSSLADVDHARATLLQLIEDSPIESVSLYAPGITGSEEIRAQ